MILTIPKHVKWFTQTNSNVILSSGEKVEVFEFKHENDEPVLSSWAKHFREHCCSDEEKGERVV